MQGSLYSFKNKWNGQHSKPWAHNSENLPNSAIILNKTHLTKSSSIEKSRPNT